MWNELSRRDRALAQPMPSKSDDTLHRSEISKQILTRVVLLIATYLFLIILWELFFWRHGTTAVQSTFTIVGGPTRTTTAIRANRSIYQLNPIPVTFALSLIVVATMVSTSSLIWRIARPTVRLGITNLVFAVAVGIVAILSLLSIGPFVIPIAAFLIFLALPFDSKS